MVLVVAQLIGGTRTQVESGPTVASLHAAVAEAVGRPPESFKLVNAAGHVLVPADTSVNGAVADGDLLLVMPQRRAPQRHIVAAALHAHGAQRPSAEEEDDEDERPHELPDGAYAWERAAVAAVQRGCRVPATHPLVTWLVIIRPYRLLVLALFLLGCTIASRLSLGPVYILGCIILAIFTNLGKRREGEASAYSLFNPGVRALPGELDAQQLDTQIRAGQM